jgi:hypothetical protein
LSFKNDFSDFLLLEEQLQMKKIKKTERVLLIDQTLCL